MKPQLLKIHASKKGVTVSFRKKPPGFSKEMVKGLTIAALFHSVLFFLFHISTAPYPADSLSISPIAVEVDLGSKIGSSKNSPQIFLMPLSPEETPTLPRLPPSAFHPYKGEISFYEPDFTPIEKIPYSALLEEEG